MQGWAFLRMKDLEEEKSKPQTAPLDRLWTTGQSNDVVTLTMTAYYQAFLCIFV